MNRRIITTFVIAIGVLLGFLFGNKENRRKLKENFEDLKYKMSIFNSETNHSLLKNAGIPDQLEDQDITQLENAKMVSEGSQYGVNYYNEIQEEDSSH